MASDSAMRMRVSALLLPVKCVEWTLACLTVAGLSSILGVTIFDVVGRYFFNAPLRGGGEIVSLSLAMTIFAAIPLVTARGEDIAMSAVKDLARGWIARSLNCVVAVVGLAIACLFAHRIWLRGNYLTETGEFTEVLEIRLAPVVFAVAISWGITALVFFALAVASLLRRRGEGDQK